MKQQKVHFYRFFFGSNTFNIIILNSSNFIVDIGEPASALGATNPITRPGRGLPTELACDDH